MSELLNSLHNDHRNYARLLELTREELEKLESSEPADFILLYDIMKYMTSYPDLYHHPAEEVIFSNIENCSPELESLFQSIANEHKKLNKLGSEAKNRLQHITSGAIVSKEEIITLVKEYVDLLSQHMNLEEGKLFPTVLKTLTAEEWEEVQSRTDNIKDPLFGEVVEEQYANLLKRIA